MRRPNEMIAAFGRRVLAWRDGESDRYRNAREACARLSRSADEIRDDTADQLRAVVRRAHRFSPYYRQRFESAGFRPDDFTSPDGLAKLPQLTKTDLRDRAPEMICTDLPREEIIESRSGGTTGIPTRFFRDRAGQTYRRALDLVIFRYYGWRDGQWIGWLWGATRDIANPADWRGKLAQRWGYRTYFLNAEQLDAASYEQFAERTNRYRPPVISAYPSLACDLVDRIDASEVKPFRVPVISTSAETLSETQRKKIEVGIADNVYARYATREFGPAAFECPEKNGMHIITDSVYLETVPVVGKKEGSGVLLVTDLINRAMPLIRYRTGDLGRIDYRPCPCGLSLPRLCAIEGRETDIIWRTDGTGISGEIIVNLVGDSRIHARVQIVQKKINEIIIRLEGKSEDHADSLQTLTNIFRDEIASDIEYRIEEVAEITRAPSGKFRYVISEIDRESRGGDE